MQGGYGAGDSSFRANADCRERGRETEGDQHLLCFALLWPNWPSFAVIGRVADGRTRRGLLRGARCKEQTDDPSWTGKNGRASLRRSPRRDSTDSQGSDADQIQSAMQRPRWGKGGRRLGEAGSLRLPCASWEEEWRVTRHLASCLEEGEDQPGVMAACLCAVCVPGLLALPNRCAEIGGVS